VHPWMNGRESLHILPSLMCIMRIIAMVIWILKKWRMDYSVFHDVVYRGSGVRPRVIHFVEEAICVRQIGGGSVVVSTGAIARQKCPEG
jgi:hypothetical protein